MRDASRSARGMVGQIIRDMPEMTENGWQASRGADVLLLSSLGALMGIPIAHKLRIPAVRAYVQPMTPTANFPPMAMFPPAPDWLAALRPYYNLASGKIMDYGLFRQMFKAPMVVAQQVLQLAVQPPHELVRQLDTPLLYGYSPSFLPKPKDWPPDCRVTGYWFLDSQREWQPSAALLDFLRAGPPPVYVGFGSMIDRDPTEMTRLVIEALEHAGQRGILLTGWGALSDVPVPDHIFPLESVPHEWLFPRVAAVVHHGGAGTTGAGLRAGKPTIIIPFTADQPFWGQRVYERGFGPKPIAHQHLSVDTLAERITTAVTTDEIRTRVEALGEQIRAEDGVGMAIDVITQYLQRRRGGHIQRRATSVATR